MATKAERDLKNAKKDIIVLRKTLLLQNTTIGKLEKRIKVLEAELKELKYLENVE